MRLLVLLLALFVFTLPGQCTTIAWDGTTLAADTQMTMDDKKLDFIKIIYSSERKEYLACAGSVTDINTIRKWFLTTKESTNDEIEGEFQALIITKDNEAHFFEEDLKKFAIVTAPFALGCGAKYAFASMYCGRTAEEAIKVAARFDLYTNDRVTIFKTKSVSKQDK